jgi:hypothetical protein
MKIRNNTKTLLVFDLPSGSIHLPGLGRGSKNVAEVPDDAIDNPQIKRALTKKWIRVLKDKVSAATQAAPPKPVATPAQPVADADPNDGSDS